MTFQVEITVVAEEQIDLAYRWYRKRNVALADRWFREIMNTIATLQEKPFRSALAIENDLFSEEVRQLLHGKAKNTYRILFTVRQSTVSVLYVRHSSQAPMTEDGLLAQ